MPQDGYLKTYGQFALSILLFGGLALLEKLFTGPLAFVTGVPDATFGQWIMAGLALSLTLLCVRITKREIIQGWLGHRSGKKIPELIGDMMGGMVLFTGICMILALVFKRDITALVATGGASLMIIGIAVRDIILALFTGIVLNIEKPFKPGDKVRIDNKYVGTIERITWRTTVLLTDNYETVFIPNISLANAVVLNMALPDTRSKRTVQVMIDYDTSVESAERILYAAAFRAADVQHMGPPTVYARKMESDGVLYEIAFTISNYRDGYRSEHAVIKSILQCLRDAEIAVSFPKSQVVESQSRGRSLDVFRLVQQCRLFRGLPDPVCQRISRALVERHFAAGATIIQAGERRCALFIVGEGMAKRTLSDRDGSMLVQERFVFTEFFGRRSLFACQAQVATVLAETEVLLYELNRQALAQLLEESPDLGEILATALSRLHWNASSPDKLGLEPPPAVWERLVKLYQGQIAANYGEQSLPTPSAITRTD